MSTSKKFWQSKKCLSYLLLLIVGCSVILATVFTRQPSDVIRDAISAFGLAIGAASTTLIGGQSFVDTAATKKK